MGKANHKKADAKKASERQRAGNRPASQRSYPIKFPRLKDGHVWDTKRLRVFLQTLVSPDGNTNFVFSGWRLDVVWPRSAVTATVGLPNNMMGLVTAPLWWIVADDDCQREGFAMELLRSIHTKWLPIHAWGETKKGERFCEAFYTAVGPLVPPRRGKSHAQKKKRASDRGS